MASSTWVNAGLRRAIDKQAGDEVTVSSAVARGARESAHELMTRDEFLRGSGVARPFFEAVLGLGDEIQGEVNWGTKGFSLRMPVGDQNIPICYGQCELSSYKTNVLYSVLSDIRRRVAGGGGARAKSGGRTEQEWTLAAGRTRVQDCRRESRASRPTPAGPRGSEDYREGGEGRERLGAERLPLARPAPLRTERAGYYR